MQFNSWGGVPGSYVSRIYVVLQSICLLLLIVTILHLWFVTLVLFLGITQQINVDSVLNLSDIISGSRSHHICIFDLWTVFHTQLCKTPYNWSSYELVAHFMLETPISYRYQSRRQNQNVHRQYKPCSCFTFYKIIPFKHFIVSNVLS
jgi:hypothetical protein